MKETVINIIYVSGGNNLPLMTRSIIIIKREFGEKQNP